MLVPDKSGAQSSSLISRALLTRLQKDSTTKSKREVEMWLQARSAEKSRIEKCHRVAVANEMWLQARSAEKSRIEKCHRVAVPNEMWLQRRGATQNEKLNSPPDHHRSLFLFRSLLEISSSLKMLLLLLFLGLASSVQQPDDKFWLKPDVGTALGAQKELLRCVYQYFCTNIFIEPRM